MLDPPVQLLAELHNLGRPSKEDVTPLRVPFWVYWELCVT